MYKSGSLEITRSIRAANSLSVFIWIRSGSAVCDSTDCSRPGLAAARCHLAISLQTHQIPITARASAFFAIPPISPRPEMLFAYSTLHIADPYSPLAFTVVRGYYNYYVQLHDQYT